VISIAKARKDETGRADRRKGNIEDRIFLPGRSNPLQLKAGAPELLLLQHMRDLCHDYSIGRHRKARAGRALSGELQRIPGIGPSMAKKLWTHYSSVKEMAAASVTDLMQIDGVGKKKAVAIYEGLSVFRG
jgi:excinuclease ABC subunit C